MGEEHSRRQARSPRVERGGSLDRGRYGMKWNFALDTGASYWGDRVDLELHLELLRVG